MVIKYIHDIAFRYIYLYVCLYIIFYILPCFEDKNIIINITASFFLFLLFVRRLPILKVVGLYGIFRQWTADNKNISPSPKCRLYF